MRLQHLRKRVPPRGPAGRDSGGGVGLPFYRDEWDALRSLWGDLLSPADRLFFQCCREEVRHTARVPGQATLQQWLDTELDNWLHDVDADGRALAGQDGPGDQPRLDLAAVELRAAFRVHLLCARAAARPGAAPAAVMSEVAGDTQFPAGMRGGFVRDLVHDLQGRPLRPDRVLRVPVALVDLWPREGERKTADAGLVAQLVLERIPEGQEEVYLAPEQAFLRLAEDFRTSLFVNVPAAVSRLLDGDSSRRTRPRFDVRLGLQARTGDKGEWRPVQTFLPECGAHARLEGESAGGAAARGVYHLLADKVPDDGVIVVARVDPQGNVDGVDRDGVRAKVRAIARDEHHFDTIVVAGESNRVEAENTLRAEKAADRIRVKDLHAGDTATTG
jgi:hypothetical protein